MNESKGVSKPILVGKSIFQNAVRINGECIT